jgi:hypothetical protein
MLAGVDVAGATQLEKRKAQAISFRSVREEFTKVSGREFRGESTM